MASGIYKIDFYGIDGCYIGQSTHLQKRITEHRTKLRSGKHYNHKLQLAYDSIDSENEMNITVLEYCDIQALDEKELYYISLLNSVDNGFNIIPGPANTGRGTTASRSKYTREQLINILMLLVDPVNSNIDISKQLDVPVSAVETIAYGKRHLWLQEEFPDEWEIVQRNIKNNYRFLSSNNISERTGNLYYVISPEGGEYSFYNIAEFARNNNLNKSHLCQLLKGNIKHHKQWKRKEASDE
jgi:hypothetical protein